jgi:hypothetical protein
MSIGTVATIAQILGPTVVAIGVVIGLVQLREFQRQRREVAAVQLVSSFQNPDFNRAVRIVWSLPDGVTAEDLRARGSTCEDAAVLISTTFESVGVLVFRRVVPMEVFDELMGDATIKFWVKLQPWVFLLREEQARQSVYEWFQWLVERLLERERRTTTAAHVKFRQWRA